MSEKKTTSKKVHTLTLEDQTKLAQANVKKMEQGKIEVMKVVEGVQGAEKLAELIERGKKNGKLSSSELMDVLENLDLESDQMDKIYDTLENLGIDTVGDDYLPELADDIMPPLEELNEIEELPEEEMVDPNTLVDSFGIDDPVRMYLKEIGKVNLLTPDEEVQLAQDMGAGDAAKEQMEELEQAGVTGYVGKVNMDRNGLPGILQETTEESVRETLRWLEGCHFDHVKPILTPRFTPSCTDELMAALGRLAQEKGLYVQSHLSENLGEIQWVKELHPDCQQYWETYDKYGLWKEHTIMAHCVHSDRRECDAMRQAGVVVAHCAGSNINLCSGVSPVREMLQQGIWVTLGSDIAGGACLPMYKVATMSIRASKIKRIETDWSEDFLTVPEAYYLATSSGHRYFGDGDGFAPGNRLHAIVVDDGDFTEASHPLTVRERFERAIYMLHRHNITAVWSDGRCVVGQMLQ